MKEQLSEVQANLLKQGKRYTIAEDIGVFKKGESVLVDSVRQYGSEIRVGLVGDKGKKDFFIIDINDNLDVF